MQSDLFVVNRELTNQVVEVIIAKRNKAIQAFVSFNKERKNMRERLRAQKWVSSLATFARELSLE